VDNKWLLEYSKLSGKSGDASVPVSMAVTDFHYLLLFKDTLKVSLKMERGANGKAGCFHDSA
jgi:hypothetical protein